MKLYFVKNENTANKEYNFGAFADIQTLKNGFYVKSIHAFLKKKYAQEYINTESKEFRNSVEIITIEIK